MRWRPPFVFLVALLGTLLIVHTVAEVDPTEVGRDTLQDKLDHLRRVDEPFDVIFVGNSHIYRTVVTDLFDETMHELGCPVRSYNLGVPGLGIHEQKVVLDAIEELPGGPPRWLVLGPVSRLDINLSDLSDLRVASFFRYQELPLVFDAWGDSESLRGRRLPEAVLAYLGAQLPYGALHHRYLAPPTPPAGPLSVAAATTDGYLSLEDAAEDEPGINERQESLDRFVASGGFERAIRGQGDLQINLGVELARLSARLDDVEASAPLLLLEPTTLHREAAAIAAAWERQVPLLNLASLEQLPQLADPDSWFDRTHLRAEPARAATVELANLMCAHIGESS